MQGRSVFLAKPQKAKKTCVHCLSMSACTPATYVQANLTLVVTQRVERQWLPLIVLITVCSIGLLTKMLEGQTSVGWCKASSARS
jgi:hypothetical protein